MFFTCFMLALYFYMFSLACSRWNNHQRRLKTTIKGFFSLSFFPFFLSYNAVTFTHTNVSLICGHKCFISNPYKRKSLIQLGDATPFFYAFAMSMLRIKNKICAFVLFRYNKKKKNLSYKRFPL